MEEEEKRKTIYYARSGMKKDFDAFRRNQKEINDLLFSRIGNLEKIIDGLVQQIYLKNEVMEKVFQKMDQQTSALNTKCNYIDTLLKKYEEKLEEEKQANVKVAEIAQFYEQVDAEILLNDIMFEKEWLDE